VIRFLLFDLHVHRHPWPAFNVPILYLYRRCFIYRSLFRQEINHRRSTFDPPASDAASRFSFPPQSGAATNTSVKCRRMEKTGARSCGAFAHARHVLIRGGVRDMSPRLRKDFDRPTDATPDIVQKIFSTTYRGAQTRRRCRGREWIQCRSGNISADTRILIIVIRRSPLFVAGKDAQAARFSIQRDVLRSEKNKVIDFVGAA